jgi:hypothetical protein
MQALKTKRTRAPRKSPTKGSDGHTDITPDKDISEKLSEVDSREAETTVHPGDTQVTPR